MNCLLMIPVFWAWYALGGLTTMTLLAMLFHREIKRAPLLVESLAMIEDEED
ncbi:hypothetical protein LJC33_00375 [Eubacteriales bacterium OttesenSCG-928-N13]|nr:hypothetical protein [Eubacteriales bacterium OttesenSCG-928-N13]